ncbi:rCG55735, partial [Rattus norvegicus]
MEKEGVAGP